jgi:hypothetical protein
MNKNAKLHSLHLSLAVAAGMTACTITSQAQGILPSATLSGTPGTGSTYDYILTLNNASTASTSIEGFWYAWIPGHFFLPSSPSSASGGSSGWTATPDGDSIQFQGNAGDAIAPGGSATFTFVTTDSPAALAGTSGGFPIGDSVAYPGTINFSGASPNVEFAVQSVPEPASLALCSGALCCLAAGRRMIRQRSANTGD